MIGPRKLRARPGARLLSLLRRIFRRVPQSALVSPRLALPAGATTDPEPQPVLLASPTEAIEATPCSEIGALTLRGVYWLLNVYPGMSLGEMLAEYGQLLRMAEYSEAQAELRLEELRAVLVKVLPDRPSTPLDRQ